jgi:23S rRNA (cytosine1962-C5)-methyltransferase
MKDRITLKPGREKAILNRHPWIFSGSLEKIPVCQAGEILPIYSSDGKFLAQGFCHPERSLAVRVFDDSKEAPDLIIKRKITSAYHLRKQVIDFSKTDCYRLINAEGDGLSGLIVDIYGDMIVIQIATWGMERLKSEIIKELKKLIHPRAIFEKSISSSRTLEGLEDFTAVLEGDVPDKMIVKENNLLFSLDPRVGQKTGLFLDQREMRSLVEKHAKGRAVLNAFSYTGGFSLAALRGGAKEACSIDSDKRALDSARENTLLNGFSLEKHTLLDRDCFKYFQTEDFSSFDFVILDPPAFAKKKADISSAARAYRDLNQKVMEKAPVGSFLLTCSCSYFVDKTLFRQLLFQAGILAKRQIRILEEHRMAEDHPTGLYHPEGEYLKSFFLYLE